MPCKSKRPQQTAGRRRNAEPEERTAAELSEDFHGRPARKVTVISRTMRERAQLAELGALIELHVRTQGKPYALNFKGKGVRVGCTPDGRQIYFEGGDQAVNLESLPLGAQIYKDHMELGTCEAIVYHTSKDFHDFEPIDYIHRMGEDGGIPPSLHYDTLNDLLFLSGGSYEARREGIIR